MATRAPEDHQEAPPAPQIKREPEDGLPRPPEPHSTPAAASQSPASDDREQTAAAAQDAQDADPAVDFAAADHADAGDDNHSGRSSESGRVTQACPFASYHYQTKTKGTVAPNGRPYCRLCNTFMLGCLNDCQRALGDQLVTAEALWAHVTGKQYTCSFPMHNRNRPCPCGHCKRRARFENLFTHFVRFKGLPQAGGMPAAAMAMPASASAGPSRTPAPGLVSAYPMPMPPMPYAYPGAAPSHNGEAENSAAALMMMSRGMMPPAVPFPPMPGAPAGGPPALIPMASLMMPPFMFPPPQSSGASPVPGAPSPQQQAGMPYWPYFQYF